MSYCHMIVVSTNFSLKAFNLNDSPTSCKIKISLVGKLRDMTRQTFVPLYAAGITDDVPNVTDDIFRLQAGQQGTPKMYDFLMKMQCGHMAGNVQVIVLNKGKEVEDAIT